MTDYSASVMDLFENTPGAGTLAPREGVFSGVVGSVADGVRVQFHVYVRRGIVADARFLAYGCPHTVAAAAQVAQDVIGRDLDVAGVDPHRLAASVEAPEWKLGRMLVVEDALRACLEAARAARAEE